MASEKQYPTTPESKVTMKQIHVTPGNVATPVAGFANDAGMNKPPAPGMYGRPGTESLPTAEKFPNGDAKAMNAFFGKGKRGTP